jgi:acetate kinase
LNRGAEAIVFTAGIGESRETARRSREPDNPASN